MSAASVVTAMRAKGPFHVLEMVNNTLGVGGAGPIGQELENHPELEVHTPSPCRLLGEGREGGPVEECLFSDMFTGRLKPEIPPALDKLFTGINAAGARITFTPSSRLPSPFRLEPGASG